MKTKKTVIFAGLFAAACAVLFFSCRSPVGLGEKLDVTGPVVDFVYPNARAAVLPQFYITGTVSDNRSDIDQLLLKAELNGSEYPKQWRYKGGSWQVSQDRGNSWEPLGAVTVPGGIDAGTYSPEWIGSAQNASWKIPIDMILAGEPVEDGEYLFTVQAWDKGGFTDDNSFKTQVFIIDSDPPVVDVTAPYLYKSSQDDVDKDKFSNPDLQELHRILDTGDEKTDPTYIGKFLTQAFTLQWQIEENLDVRLIDLRFYKHDKDVDGEEDTPLPDDYIFRYRRDIPAHELTSVNNVKPNGKITVPALGVTQGTAAGTRGTSEEGGEWELKNPLGEKTTIKVAALCYDAAENPNIPAQEKVLGYFIYWPAADVPWIAFPDGMKELTTYGNIQQDYFPSKLEAETYMIYPGRKLRATAFHAYGLKEVEYSLWSYTVYGDETTITTAEMGQVIEGFEGKTAINEQKPNGGYSTVCQWEFEPPARSGYFVIKARAKSASNQSEEYEMLFRVQDITFPNFPVEPSPSAGEPLYKAIKGTSSNAYITISGYVSDATSVESLNMVWINPKSRNYAAMSQLQYFRDAEYAGWQDALSLTPGNTKLEPTTEGGYNYDWRNPNRLWNLILDDSEGVDIGQDLGTGLREATYRKLFSFSVDVPLSDLDIVDDQGKIQPPYLASQVFLLRVGNPDGKTTIITYAPQGDVLSPIIKIDNVKVVSAEGVETECFPGIYKQVPQFKGGETITVNGTWTEDSTGFLAVESYLYNNMEIEINGFKIPMLAANFPGVTIVKTPTTGKAAEGTFTITANVSNTDPKNPVPLSSVFDAYQPNMKDTLVVNADLIDIGGNPSGAMASWLVESDTLRFLRLSSEDDDTAYRAGEKIEIYMEFNKPLQLKTGRSNDPVLVLNTGGRAVYGKKDGTSQENQAVRQYFTYTVGAGENTAQLNVTGISIDGGTTVVPINSPGWQAADYPFTWVHTPVRDPPEEMRITRVETHILAAQGERHPASGGVMQGTTTYTRALPVSDSSPGFDNDYVFTLKGGKKISVDTTGPDITGFSVSPKGWHGEGVEINITATFSENVRLGNPLPYLILGSGGTSPNTVTTSADDIRVNNNRITFKYVVKNNDTTGTDDLTVTGFGGEILDVPGTPMPPSAVTSMTPADRTLTGVYLDTTAPPVPVVTVYNANNQGGTVIGNSGDPALRTLGNLYHAAMSIRIAGTTGDQHLGTLGRVEYSLNNGANWTPATSATININNADINNGSYTVIARQTDQAGNVSANSNGVTFNLDRGSLISGITSFTTNGDYTYNSNRQTDDVNITVNLRKPLVVSAASITLNVTGGTPQITFTPSATAVSQLSFTYRVRNNETTGVNTKLNVTGLSITATDGGTAVDANFLAVPDLTASNNLAQQKDIYIVTGGLTISSTVLSTGSNPVNTDNSINATLTVTFNHSNLARGTGQLTITQAAANYRIPTVLTETQRNRFRSIANFDTYYIRGTNGYVNGASDTSTKYVLDYNKVPSDITPNAGGTDDEQFAEAFRQAERIEINANASVITLSGNTLTINLTGTNALQVPGAQYAISIPASFVQDSLSNTSPVNNTTSSTVGGIAKPFIRVKRAQEEIVTRAGSATASRIRANQPLTTEARLDCRTPGTTIYYLTGTAETYVTYTGNGTIASQNWSAAVFPPADTTNPAAPDQPGDPQTTTTGRSTTNPITIGSTTITNAAGTTTATTTIDNVQGLQWRIRAKANSGSNWSADSEEMAYRSVLTYRVRDMRGDSPGQYFGSGDQVWIRGGDAIGSSNIPGFPLTWEDDWVALANEGRRAGIRVLDLVEATTALYTASIWRWVTWEINVPTYFDMILGRDTDSTDAVATQYGPKQYAYQRAGWTSYKDYYRMNPGKHRWLYVNSNTDNAPGNSQGKGLLNFAQPFMVRPDP